MSGVFTFDTKVMAERAANSAGTSKGAPRNQEGWNWVKSAVYHQFAQSEIERCETAALKRSVWVIVQLVSTPPAAAAR